jgi:type IV pilus assembly protein PilV
MTRQYRNRMGSLGRANPQESGFMMMEVLVTLLVILFGVMGLAATIVRSQTSELESYQRVQAMLLARDMVDRINANRYVSTCYSNGTALNSVLEVGTNYTGPPTCTVGTNTQRQTQAVRDITAWSNLLKGSAEASGGSNIGAMITAIGCVKLTDAANNIYRVSVAWQGLNTTADPTDDTCGSDVITTTGTRRVISMPVRIANLS